MQRSILTIPKNPAKTLKTFRLQSVDFMGLGLPKPQWITVLIRFKFYLTAPFHTIFSRIALTTIVNIW
jgi:hypothetical protein